jgi:thioredoxin
MKNKTFYISLVLALGILLSNPGVTASTPIETEGDGKKVEDAIQSISDAGKPIHLTKKDFLEKVMNYEKNRTEWVYEGDKPCIIDFYADWCAPCKKAAPVLEELAKEYAGEIYVYKINTDKERELSSAFGIRNIPAFLWVPMEGRPQMSSGIARTQAETKKMFKEMIDKVLLNQAKSN